MTKNEVNVLRANIIGGIDTYIKEVIGDEYITDTWLNLGMPDGYTEDDLMADMEDETTFKSLIRLFTNLL